MRTSFLRSFNPVKKKSNHTGTVWPASRQKERVVTYVDKESKLIEGKLLLRGQDVVTELDEWVVVAPGDVADGRGVEHLDDIGCQSFGRKSRAGHLRYFVIFSIIKMIF